jgi:hypothetical protein
VRTIVFRDEKLYAITAQDYGGLVHRVPGALIYSIAKGVAIAVVGELVFLDLRLPWKFWLAVLVPLALVCSIGVGFLERRVYICEIEIFPDRIVRHSGEKPLGIGRSEVRSISERSHWTLFGLTDGILIRGKNASIFIPAACAHYAEIKSRLGGWCPVTG